MSFLYPSLLWIGLPLAAVPVLIHLLNLRRQRKIDWAAMQFLLESQRQNRRWIFLRELLLLAARVAAIALLAVMLSHLVLRDQWARLLGSGETHHLILVDDSYSMSDRDDDRQAFDEAKRVVAQIATEAHHQATPQRVTLLSLSEARKLTAGTEPEFFRQPVDDRLRTGLEATLTRLAISETDVDLVDGLQGASRLPEPRDDQTQVLYLISDFRQRQLQESAELRNLLGEFAKTCEQIHLVQCVRRERANLAITELAAESGLRAAGVEMWMKLELTNYGSETARDVIVQLEQDGHALPAVVVEEVPPGESVPHRFRIVFTETGSHWLSASLESDAVDVDNHRFFACNLSAAMPVLIIDGSADGRDGYYLATALNPGGRTRTGWQPRVEPPEFLRDRDDLDQYSAICLLDVPQLDPVAAEALENYTRTGGGVGFFLGPRAERGFYTQQLYRQGEGLFPAPLRLPTQLLDMSERDPPDVDTTDHPLFRALAGTRNSFLPLLMVDYYYALVDGWQPSAESQTSIIARLRNGAPLVVEKQFGRGRVVAHLTKLAPTNTELGRWSNWSLNPAFPVLANELMGYLSATRQRDPILGVSHDLVVAVAEKDYEPTLRFRLPTSGERPVELAIDATPLDGELTARVDELSASGICEVQLTPKDGPLERRLYAVNVPTGEGDLKLARVEDIQDRLTGIDFQFHYADEMTSTNTEIAGFQMSQTLLFVLVGLLLAEQLLAYSASYHVAGVGGGRR